MTKRRWQRVRELFSKVRELSPARQQALLAEPGETWLRREVASLLRADERAQGFLEPLVTRPLPEGMRIGPYRLGHPIGRGGMGLVYLGVRDDGSFQKRVAIKLLHGPPDPALLHRFRIERQTLAALDHPNIIRLLDGGHTEDGNPYLVTEYIQGLTIDACCRQSVSSMEDRLRLFQRVCAAVSCAHRNLVIHGDIKPSNILVGEDGVPKLIDFGAATLQNPELGSGTTEPSEQRLRLFTPEFAAPEQLRGERSTVASDVYALGLLLHVLLTDRSPHWQLPSASEEASGHDDAVGELPRPSTVAPERRSQLRGDLDCIVRRATAAEAKGRYASVEELAQDVTNHLARRPVTARPATLAYRTSALLRRNRATLVNVALAVGGLGSAAALGGWSAGRAASRAAAISEPTRASEAAQSAAQLRGIVQRVATQASQGDKEAQIALALLYFAHGHLLRSLGEVAEAQISFHRGALARQAAPPPPFGGPRQAPPWRPVTPPDERPEGASRPAAARSDPQPAAGFTKP